MTLLWTDESWDDYLYWQTTDKKMVKKINELIKSIQRTAFEGIGKPEPLRFELSGCWSRRIDSEHRLIYEVEEGMIRIVAARFHYS
ncbi:MAG: Txe/YoeB family addiction module toxin [Sulfuricurvum sp.]